MIKTYETIVLGGGIAGLLTGKLFDAPVITSNIGGQSQSNYILGPRIIHYSKQFYQYLSQFWSIDVQTVKVGYEDEYQNECDINDEYIKKYSQKSRMQSENISSNILSSQKNEYLAITLCGLDIYSSYNKLVQFLILDSDIIVGNIKSINTIAKTVQYSTDSSVYSVRYSNNILNTLRADITFDLLNIKHDYDFSMINKHFYITQRDINSKYHYVYSLHNDYSRKTYHSDYTVYQKNGSILNSDKIDGKQIVCKMQNIPLQLKYSYGIDRINNSVINIGRYSQWYHGIKINDIYKKAMEIKCKTD